MSSNYKHKQRWRTIAREWITRYAGNKCRVCGYDRYIGNLIFHHVDPQTKSAEVSTLIKNTQGWTTILSEVEKCVLVCNRCHGEIHAGLVESPQINHVQRDKIYREILEDQPIPSSRKFRYCQCCGKRMKGNKYCSRECVAKSQEKAVWPPNLEELVKNSSKRTVAQILGVSDKAVAKRLKR